MYKKSDDNSEQNFWISYADLMAGLLFVFILVVGAIVVKTMLIQSDLNALRADLEKEKAALHMSESELSNKKKTLRLIKQKLQESMEKNLHLAMQISRLQSEVDDLQGEILSLKNDIAIKSAKMSMTQKELDEVKALLLATNHELEECNGTKARLERENNVYLNMLNEQENTIHLKESEIAMLQKALLLKKREYQKVVEDLNITKLKIKNLTGIKITVVKALKERLKNSIQIDPKSGAVRFASNILFNQGSATLKPEAKQELKHLLGRYVAALLDDPKIRKYISTIIIEGHTNSDGSYLYNLNLSQQRALAVMEFLYKEFPRKRALLRKYLTASGRSFAEPIYKNGKEDKEASRRIEIKFRIKNEEAVKELMNYINKER